jgi:hypothetical protein
MPAQPDAPPPGMTPPGMTPPGGTRRDARGAPGASELRNSRRRRKPASLPDPAARRWWGSLQGGLGVSLIAAAATVGAIATMVTRNAPGFTLGVSVVVGTVAAALAVRPRAGRMILPAPVLSYLVAALVTGVIYNRSADSSKAALAIGAAQWIASGFVAMATATALAIVLITIRWYLWRRRLRAARDLRRSGPPAPPLRPPASREPFADPRYPAGREQPGSGPLQLFQRSVAEHQVLDAVVGAKVDLGLGLVAVTIGGNHRAEPELVVGDHVPGRQRRHQTVPR